jgi:hypothetical protein
MGRQSSQNREQSRDWLWSPASTAVFALALGVPSFLTGYPWLFPSLGPTMSLKVHAPDHVSARPFNTLLGHLLAAIAGAIAVVIFDANHDPSVLSTGAFTADRLWATVLGLPLCCLSQIVLRATHSPAASTTLLITLGSFTVNTTDMAVLLVGILAVTAIGEAAHHLRARFGER